MFLSAFYLVLVAVLNISEAQNNLTDRCDAYKFLEDKASCGKKGYLIQFGLRNCLKFSSPDIRSRFSSSGLAFLDCTTKCLITRLQNLFTGDLPTCSTVEKSAFASHLPCYLECNFCKICKTEKASLLSSYDKSDLFSYEAMKTAIKLLKTCGLFSCFRSS
ncbi:unnamed protein product [Cylicocyclus nassatus]|uniref:Uncharacterized protein n=1 Tax=Cylicocyclus nassatus TaxID=53992 RepID=A0AA36M2G1_CYLNA|nr:unnamed protein product [Cylicocyclus nassatus]